MFLRLPWFDNCHQKPYHPPTKFTAFSLVCKIYLSSCIAICENNNPDKINDAGKHNIFETVQETKTERNKNVRSRSHCSASAFRSWLRHNLFLWHTLRIKKCKNNKDLKWKNTREISLQLRWPLCLVFAVYFLDWEQIHLSKFSPNLVLMCHVKNAPTFSFPVNFR